MRWLWGELRARPEAFACLNDPGRVIGRYQLLRALHEKGVNDFNVHRVRDLDRVQFPAFVRYENLHRGNLSGLLRSRTELEDALAALLLGGEREEDLIVTEWLDYRSEDGYFWKYGAHICGEEILAKHLFISTQWMIKAKYSDRSLVGDKEQAFIDANEHVDQLRPVFELSGCDWARVDYSFWRGRLQVWEVNDNPEMGKKWKTDRGRRRAHAVFFPRFTAAINRLCAPIEPGADVEFPVPSAVALG
jgi:hypothetical protein